MQFETLLYAVDGARIGTPYSRMWGAYLSGMWLYPAVAALGHEADREPGL